MEKGRVISSLFWKFSERIGAQCVNLIVSIILARILAPSEYGIIALTTVFITISNVFVESGMPSALIQKKDADELDFSTVFYFNIFMSIFMYIILYCSSPLIAHFYKQEQLINVLRVLGLVIIIAGLKSVQNAYVAKKMIFKKFFICTLLGTIFSAILGIIMAYNNYGVWALVTQQLANTMIDTIMLWIFVKWRPKLQFSFKRLKKLFDFAWKLLVSGLIETIYSQLNGLVIGKVYTSKSLAYYNKANQIPSLVMNNVNNSISSVMFSVMSNEQDDIKSIKKILKKSIILSSFILMPLLVGLAAIAKTLIIVLLTEKWIFSVRYMQILCFAYALYPIHINNLEVLKALGRSDLFLKLEILKKVFGVLLMVISIPFGVFAMVISVLINSIISAIINAFPLKKILKYGFIEQLIDIFPIIMISIVMGISVIIIGYIDGINIILKLIIQIVMGVIIYGILAFVFMRKELDEVINSISGIVKGRK